MLHSGGDFRCRHLYPRVRRLPGGSIIGTIVADATDHDAFAHVHRYIHADLHDDHRELGLVRQ